jgi:hypothetical protein
VGQFSTASESIRSLLNQPAVDEATGAEVAANLERAEQTLAKLEGTATEVSSKLERINQALGRRAPGLDVNLAFSEHNLTSDLDPALTAIGGFKGGLPGITPEAPDGAKYVPGTAVNWPPWAPVKKPTLWSRFTRSAIAIPLLLIAVIAVAGVAYKLVKNHDKPAASAGAGGISSYGSVKVIPGTPCVAGTATASVELAGAQAKNGNYIVTAEGTLANRAGTSLTHVVVDYAVTYQDGYTAHETAAINGGSAIGGKTTKSWFAVAAHSEGSVPPQSVKVTAITAGQVLPACA